MPRPRGLQCRKVQIVTPAERLGMLEDNPTWPWGTSSQNHAFRNPEVMCESSQVRHHLGGSANQGKRKARVADPQLGEGTEQHVKPFLVLESRDAHDEVMVAQISWECRCAIVVCKEVIHVQSIVNRMDTTRTFPYKPADFGGQSMRARHNRCRLIEQ